MYEFQKRCLDGIYICLRGDYIQDPETSKMMGSRPFEKFDKSGDSGIIYINKQLGKKFGKHCSDWGLDHSNSKDRDNLKTIINDIVSSPDEIRIGKWSGQNQDVLFYSKSGDLVILKQINEFVSIMKGGASSAGFKNARKR